MSQELQLSTPAIDKRNYRLRQLVNSSPHQPVTDMERRICDQDLLQLHAQVIHNARHRAEMRHIVEQQLEEFKVVPLTPSLVPDDETNDYRNLYLQWLSDYLLDGHEVTADQLVSVKVERWFIATITPANLTKPLLSPGFKPLSYAVLIPRQVHIFNAPNWNVGLGLNSSTFCFMYYYREGKRVRPGTNHPHKIVACPGLLEVLESEQF